MPILAPKIDKGDTIENKELSKPAKERLENLPGYRAYYQSGKMDDQEFARVCKEFEYRRIKK